MIHSVNPIARAVQGVISGGEPSGSFSDADYPLAPAYEESGAIFFNSAATGANDGSSWSDGYTDGDTALTALCGRNDEPESQGKRRGCF